MGPFWEGFGSPKLVFFALFRNFLGGRIRDAFRKAKKSTKKSKKANFSAFGGRACGAPPPPPGRDLEMGLRTFVVGILKMAKLSYETGS